MDELNSLLGLARNQKISTQTKKELREAQEKLFIVQAFVAYAMTRMKECAPKLKKEEIERIEKVIDALEKKVKPEKHFIIPGAVAGAAWLDYARAVARRIEREYLTLSKKNKNYRESAILAYLNRLSSLLYALARMENRRLNKKEDGPRYK